MGTVPAFGLVWWQGKLKFGAMKTMTDANLAVARVAYACSDVAFIYPITPSSPMGEKADECMAAKLPNLWGVLPEVVEMQSECGA